MYSLAPHGSKCPEPLDLPPAAGRPGRLIEVRAPADRARKPGTRLAMLPGMANTFKLVVGQDLTEVEASAYLTPTQIMDGGGWCSVDLGSWRLSQVYMCRGAHLSGTGEWQVKEIR